MKKTFCFLVTWTSCVFGLCPVANIDDPCDGENVQFYINTFLNPVDMEQIYINDSINLVSKSSYTPLNQTMILIHGFMSNRSNGELAGIRQAYYMVNPYANIITIDYSKLSTFSLLCYANAVYNVRYVGKCIAKFITALQDLQQSKLELHAIGPSLGAEVIASVAESLKPYKIPRATGLDPAGPLFYTDLAAKHLSADSGDFVDIIHTDGLVLGNPEILGHADFYVNGGVLIQPNCTSSDIFQSTLCAHGRAVILFIESITTNVGFYGYKCNSVINAVKNDCENKPPYALMGEFADPNTRGIYFVPTNVQPPYAKGRNL